MHKVLVLDSNQRSALAIIRSLGRQGFEIIAADHAAKPLGAASRYASAQARYPDPATSPAAFVREVTVIAERLGVDTIFPVTDLTTMLLVSQSNPSKMVRLAAPSHESYEALTDKAQLLELAGRLGMPAPITRTARNAAGVIDSARDIGFPVVIKPARSRYLKNDRVFSTSVEIARDREQLLAILGRITWLADIPCLVQQFIAGHGAGIFALYASSKPAAWFAHRRLREKPPTGGVSVLSESVPIDRRMQELAAKLLSSASWNGVAMVEFRIGNDDIPYLMEVNGRFWGSLQLAIDCGVDFPWLLYQAIHGSPIATAPRYRNGRRLRWLLGDVDSLLISLRRPDSSQRARAQFVLRFLGSFADPRCRQEVLRMYDPCPGFREAANWLKALRSSMAG